MKGSEKQVAWAQKIKRQILEIALDDILSQAISRDASDEYLEEIEASYKEAAESFDQASWWIDVRPNGNAPVRETCAAINEISKKAKAIRLAKKDGEKPAVEAPKSQASSKPAPTTEDSFPKLSFGKYKGWTMAELAQAGKYGRNYLCWCVLNLQNPAHSRAAELALKTFIMPKAELLYRLFSVEPDYKGCVPEEIERDVENEIAQAEADAKWLR